MTASLRHAGRQVNGAGTVHQHRLLRDVVLHRSRQLNGKEGLERLHLLAPAVVLRSMVAFACMGAGVTGHACAWRALWEISAIPNGHLLAAHAIWRNVVLVLLATAARSCLHCFFGLQKDGAQRNPHLV